MKNLFSSMALATCLGSLLASVQPVLAQGATAFTYQGQLTAGTNAGNGAYDMSFAVYDANVAGDLIAGPITNSAVPVTNGLFTVLLNFGSNVFTGTNYWVQMAVSHAGAGTFSTLVPREQLTPAPYAISLVAPQVNALCPPGSVMAYMGTTAPPGWLMCNGTNVSRITYSALFAVIGTASGAGDGSTTFNLPNLQGVFLRGVDNGAGQDPDTLSRSSQYPGGNAGDAVGSYEVDQFASHTHSSTREIGYAQGDGGYHASEWTADTGRQDSFTTTAAGGNETRSKNVYVNYIIKY